MDNQHTGYEGEYQAEYLGNRVKSVDKGFPFPVKVDGHGRIPLKVRGVNIPGLSPLSDVHPDLLRMDVFDLRHDDFQDSFPIYCGELIPMDEEG